MSHHCHAKNCKLACAPERLMCFGHWNMVPKNLQKEVWNTYRVGQCNDKNPSKEWMIAAEQAIKTVWEKEKLLFMK